MRMSLLIIFVVLLGLATPVVSEDCFSGAARCQTEIEARFQQHPYDKDLYCQDMTYHLKCLFRVCPLSAQDQQGIIQSTKQSLASSDYFCDLDIDSLDVAPVTEWYWNTSPKTPCGSAPVCINSYLAKLQSVSTSLDLARKYCPYSEELVGCLMRSSCVIQQINQLVDSISKEELFNRQIYCELDIYKGTSDGGVTQIALSAMVFVTVFNLLNVFDM